MSKPVRDKLPEGFNCSTCAAFHPFTGYVAAHWYERLTHTCDNCGAKHDVIAGRVRQIKKGKAEATHAD